MKNQKILTFLRESNLIEGVGEEGLKDSIKAFEYLIQIKPPLTEKHILKTHKILMKSLNSRIAGNFREVPVGIYSGGVCKRHCPESTKVPKLLERHLEAVNSQAHREGGNAGKTVVAMQLHVDFEIIHPFEDGNGRVGRLIWTWLRKQMGLPVLIIYNKNKQEYYKLFK